MMSVSVFKATGFCTGNNVGAVQYANWGDWVWSPTLGRYKCYSFANGNYVPQAVRVYIQ